MTTLITKTITKICIPLVILFSISLLLAGHNNPGGGFIGGVMFASVISLTYVVFGLKYIKSFFNPSWDKWFGFGLLLSSLTAFGAIVYGYNFFRSSIKFVEIPLYGEIELASATLFDIGVYFVVIGTLLHIFKNVGEDK
ncbi:monovalent cation/H+ antiporter subunit B [Methanohalophilus euhalobius]|jgi:multicomponent Na+:H+ antiporter subunit B|uniref:Monovalent cation/H+ antiporter subunit B n=1 Tax=Methanohalophilus euhalobius TaxID=51203 RepID=A0A314ZVV5_9EURY|nr:monovalent cation/H+ antiporter subunit B [Methanohalophilus euhalobius]PQV42590.1 multisubunit sodium/proton antiporter MrpB subunit [Methanohalophilus euhalobius]RNI08628.1 monovalent cation/H+ antiporter subunit B [Methanohalophilus euhalobius]